MRVRTNAIERGWFYSIFAVTFLLSAKFHTFAHLHYRKFATKWHIGNPPNIIYVTTLPHTLTHTHNHLRRFGFCPGQSGWAGTKRNIHPFTLIVVINHPYLLSPSTTIHGIRPIQSACFTVSFHNLSPSFLWSTSCPGTLHFILHTCLCPIIIFFSQHMPIPSQPILL